MFIMNYDQESFINSAHVTEIYISELEHEEEQYSICAKVMFDGVRLLSKHKTKEEAITVLNIIFDKANTVYIPW